MTTELKTPAEWEDLEGYRVPNRFVYHVDGRTDETPIDYETFRAITQGLTVIFTRFPDVTTA